MQIWSQEYSSFVDFADGYSYLSFLPINFGVKTETITPADISTLLHEFTHQLALRGPFGWVCSYFQAVRSIAKIYSELHASIEFPNVFAKADVDDTYAKILASETFFEVYGDCLANYYDLIDSYRWLLEGIALFVQLDFKLSTEFNTASEIFHFSIEMVKTEQFRGEKNNPTLADIFAFVDNARESKYESGLLQILLENTKPDAAPYFMGYLMVKQLQRDLVKKDKRLQDPEIFFIFLQGYFFFDKTVINLCEVKPRCEYQTMVSSFVKQRVVDLLSCNIDNLKLIVDVIIDFENAPINFVYLDYSATIRTGQLVRWADREALNKCANNLVSYAIRTRDLEIFSGHREHVRFNEVIETVVNGSITIFHKLRNIMQSFKLKHIERAILGFNVQSDDNYVVITSVGVHGSPLALWDTMPIEAFEPILREAQNGAFEIERNPGRMPAILNEALRKADMEQFAGILANLYRQNKLLIVQDYDLYLLPGRERCRLWVRDDFIRVDSYHWKQEDSAYQIKSRDDEQMLKQVGGFFYHGEYLPLLRVTKIIGGPDVTQDFDFGRNVLLNFWGLIYPQCKASDKEMNTFASQKLKVISVSPYERQIMRSLYRKENPAIKQLDTAVHNINRRWQYYTGRNLLKTVPNGNSKNLEINL